MRSVTIVTLRRFCVSELRHFSVIRVEICLRNFFMAAAAFGHDFKLETVGVGAGNGVRGMTIIAYRQFLVRFRYEFGMHTFFKAFFNPMMAFAAGRRNILVIDARSRIFFWQNAMRGVTVRTGRSHRQAALHEASPVNAFRIMLDDTVLGTSVAHRCFLPFAVTGGTKAGNICRKDRRCRFRLPENAMRAVTILAGRTVGIPFRDELTVNAYLEFLADLRVTRSAIHFFRNRLARTKVRSVDFGVTLAARNFRMSRFADKIRVHKQGATVRR